MLAGLEMPPELEGKQVISAMLADLRSGEHRGDVVDSSPGAGKSALLVRAAIELAAAAELPVIIAQANEQVDDLMDPLAQTVSARMHPGGARRMAELLDAHLATEPVHLNVPVKFPNQWEAIRSVMANLTRTSEALSDLMPVGIGLTKGPGVPASTAGSVLRRLEI